MKTKKNSRILVFSFMLAAFTLAASNLNAQEEGNGGLFGRGMASDDVECGRRGLLNRGGDTEEGFNLFNQQFGDENGGFNLFNQIFGQDIEEETPLGNGMFILMAAGAGYALKKRKNNRNNQKS